ncbi:MAG: preprotein translocase subunit YajC [Planctomycetota bacterium]|nr:preprotein translocase subunit YajC [Planctomycetota bacterium]MEE2888854.1 preprotein translocase subunit YajC [Planctomycetota bacterium]
MSGSVVIGSGLAICVDWISLGTGSLLTLAQTEGVAPGPAAAEGSSAGPSFIDLLPMFALMWIVVYYVMIRPQRKQAREHTQMLSNLQKHDQVRTIGGIIGKVVQVDQDQDTVILVVDESKNVRMRVTRQSVAAVLSGEEIPAKIKEEDTAR